MTSSKLAYYGKKVLVFFFSVLILSLAIFYLSRLTPTDPLVSYYGDRAEKMTAEEKNAAREKLGLDKPIHIQYLHWLEGLLQGEFGISYKYKQPVTEVISQRLGNTLLLGGVGFLLTFLLALILGTICAWQEERWLDKILCKLGTVTSCIPEFWLSLVLILVFSVTLRWLPSSGAYSAGKAGDIIDRILHLILPMSVIVVSHLWYYAYLVRNKLVEEIRSDYVLLDKAKGLTGKQILFCHCLRSILPSYLSMMAISVPHILGGTYVVETVFGYPGVGTLCYESARYGDYNLLMLLSLATGILVIFCNLAGQIASERIDPRMRAEEVPEVSRS